jgi:hypothetical protein
LQLSFAGICPPSEYRLKGPLLDTEAEKIELWKNQILGNGGITVTGDGWTNLAGVNCSNIEAVTRFGAVHISIHERTCEDGEKNADC